MKIIIKNLNLNIYTTSENLSKDIEKLKEAFCDSNENKNQTSEPKYKPTTKKELKELVDNLDINLGDIDTSLITSMSHLFENSERTDFSGIETWDVSNVTDMWRMFKGSRFNHDISNWNVSKVINMLSIFNESSFNQDISDWDVSSVKDMRLMFAHSDFNQDISNWKIDEECETYGMFECCSIKEEFKPHKEPEE